MTQPLNVVDLFCGAGGLSYGLKLADLNILSGYDNNPDCVYPFERNVGSPCHVRDINKVDGSEIIKLFPKRGIKILAGCAPCQPFSSLSNKNKERTKDEKWALLEQFSRLIREVQPDIVTMENVPKLRKEQPFADFCSNLDSLDYQISGGDVIRCEGYGVPQKRRRLVLLASRFGELNMIKETHTERAFLTVADTIRPLEPLRAGEYSKTDLLHRCQSLSEMNLNRIRASEPGGTWKEWPLKLRLKCHDTIEGKKYMVEWNGINHHPPLRPNSIIMAQGDSVIRSKIEQCRSGKGQCFNHSRIAISSSSQGTAPDLNN